MPQQWTGCRRKNNPCPLGLHHPEGGRQLRQQHWHHMPRKATAKLLWRTPTNTNQAVQEHYCLPTTEVYCIQCQKNKLFIYRTKLLSHLSCTQRKRALDKENPCLMSSTEPWLTPNPGTWHPDKLNPVRRRMGNGRGSLRGSSPDQTCSHRWTAGWLSGLLWSSPWPSYSGKVTEMRERYRESDSYSDTKSAWEHNKIECIFTGSCVVSGQAGWCLKAGL